MAGIEQIEVHSRSYIVRWVGVEEGHTISWSVQPHKKSINFGIVKHPGTSAASLSTPPIEELNSTVTDAKIGRFAKRDTTAEEQLASKGFTVVNWHGKCEADRVSMGTFDIPSGKGGMYGLVFDNTFSKQTSKTATFVLLTYPTDAPPQTTHHLPNLGMAQTNASHSSLGPQGQNLAATESVDSLQSQVKNASRTRRSSLSAAQASATPAANGNYHTGTLMKRRRKKGQGYARRFFSLDYSSCTLSYYQSRNSSALRGAIPLSLAAIAADETRREINIDSGAEIWHLRAGNPKEFQDWARALEKASRISRGVTAGCSHGHGRMRKTSTTLVSTSSISAVEAQQPNPDEIREWAQVETIVSRIVGTRDALRRLANDLASNPPGDKSQPESLVLPLAMDDNESIMSSPAGDDKKSFWKQKPSSSHLHSTAAAAALATVASTGSSLVANALSPNVVTGDIVQNRKSRSFDTSKTSLKNHCETLLIDLDAALSEFRGLIAANKQRRTQSGTAVAQPRNSIDSISTADDDDEFFDAEAGEGDSRIVRIDNNQSGDEAVEEDEPEDEDEDEEEAHDSSSISSVEDEADTGGQDGNLYPAKPKSLTPLPIEEPVQRRKTIPPSTVAPPSLIAFFRKNVGKDLSTISMPVSSNEPLSLLQKVAEQLEYAQLLQKAAACSVPKDRLIIVAAFALSQFSSSREKERSIRKPFNPLLGETFELVRTDKEVPGGFRLLVEKVSHRPVRVAMQADAANWSFSQSPAPAQKFWGKSAEITTEGRVRVVLRLQNGQDELYSWSIATMFLRNVVMGEKYVEPVGTMTITNETTGAQAVAEFPAKGMFGGRAEDVTVNIFNENGASTTTKIVGNWTQSLRVLDKGKAGEEIWKAGKLVDNAAQTYGMTEFVAGLNEITSIEKGKLPPTDTRLRPDQRLAEVGDVDSAEEMKAALEEAQRTRRRELEESGGEYKPKWFVQVAAPGAEGGEEVWKLKTGKDGYWEERTKGAWTGITEIFKV